MFSSQNKIEFLIKIIYLRVITSKKFPVCAIFKISVSHVANKKSANVF